MKYLYCLFLFVASLTYGQQRYLVSPNNEFIPINKGESASGIIQRSTQSTCSNRITVGTPPTLYPPDVTINIGHKDVIGEWFVFPANGTIDTIFWENGAQIGALDSTLYLRAYVSRIGYTYGPGHGTFPPPCTPWGYYVDANDHDNGVAGFPDQATDTTWHSTISGGTPSLPPFTSAIFGIFLGVAYTAHANQINHAALMDIGPPLSVMKGQNLFLAMRVKGPDTHPNPVDEPTAFKGSISQAVNDVPRTWIFYEHPSNQPTNLYGLSCGSANPTPAGWTAIGGTANPIQWNFWYSMTVTSNSPPVFQQIDRLEHTLSTSSRTVTAVITDCNVAMPESAGVASVFINYSLNGIPAGTLTMSNIGGDTYSATLPGASAGSTVSYKMTAIDWNNDSSSTPYYNYKVFSVENLYYVIDTAATYSWEDISASGTAITNWFDRTISAPPKILEKHGTAGPIDLGGTFKLFDDSVRYAWIGTAGGVSFSNSPTDTTDINLCQWKFPFDIPSTCMPGKFVAPLFNDEMAVPLPGYNKGHGTVFYKQDGSRFIIEWKNVGNYADSTDSATTFEAIFDMDDNSIVFQYNTVNGSPLHQSGITGLQTDQNYKWLAFNTQGAPNELTARDNRAIKFKEIFIYTMNSGWNLISLPCRVPDLLKTSVFPNALSLAFTYEGAYNYNHFFEYGKGYWLKFNEGPVGITCLSKILSDTIRVNNAWNMIGSISSPISTSSIIPIGASIVSNFLGYNGGYFTTTSIQPGQGYWVKCNGSGQLILSSNSIIPRVQHDPLSEMNRLTIQDATGRSQTLYFGSMSSDKLSYYELPPLPPGGIFDARFASNNMIATPESGKDAPVLLSSAVYPVTISWESKSTSLAILQIDGRELSMKTSGSTHIPNPTSQIGLSFSNDPSFPKEFVLEQNYPNPFNPTTSIRYAVVSTQYVSLKVYDLLGQVVAMLVDEVQYAGYKSVEWNAEKMASGIYFYKLEAGTFTETKKMILMR